MTHTEYRIFLGSVVTRGQRAGIRDHDIARDLQDICNALVGDGFKLSKWDLPQSSGADEIVRERDRQECLHDGALSEMDDNKDPLDLVAAAISYAQANNGTGSRKPSMWPLSGFEWTPKDQRTNLVRAGAFIAAAIDRMDRDIGSGD